MDKIFVKGAKVHNLKNISCEIPKRKFIVISGVSGSGKSSFAFDTLYAEGQRRYVESLSSYARQFLGVLEKPEVERIDGLSPAISIEQRSISKNPRSTVATATEIYDYLRVLYARVGDIFCYNCSRPIKKVSVDQIVDELLFYEGKIVTILSPVVRGKKGEFKEFFKSLTKKGFTKVLVDGQIKRLESEINLEKNRMHNISIIIDKLKIDNSNRMRLSQSLELSLKESSGLVSILTEDNEERLFNTSLSCPYCNISYGEISPRSFSFNSPMGACPACHGLGYNIEADEELIVANVELSLWEGALHLWTDISKRTDLIELAKILKVDLKKSYKELPEFFKRILLYGIEDEDRASFNIPQNFTFESVTDFLKRVYHSTDSNWMQQEMGKYLVFAKCKVCNGARLKKEYLSVKINGYNIYEITKMDIFNSLDFFKNKISLDRTKGEIAKDIIKEIIKKLEFLINVGVGYLTLERSVETLSGGEAQRVHLATQIGSGLNDVLYVLDEPSIGLHARDVGLLIKTLKELRDRDNTVIVVEHDKNFIKESDHIIDFGPGAGDFGGEIIFQGSYEEILKTKDSLTGKFLSGKEKVFEKKMERKIDENYYILIKKASEHNLKKIDVKIPLGTFVCVTGVSGSGKSTLVNDILYNAIRRYLRMSRIKPGKHEGIDNLHLIDKVINIDQSPIGRTPRSNPATYTGVFTYIRDFFSQLKESKIRGYKPGRFSFNVKGGRCEACEGDGYKKIEMYFLPPVYVQCDVCNGKRFNEETLQVKYKGKNIADVLEMTVVNAIEHFKEIPKIVKKLEILNEVGLGYIKLGQPAVSLSGGEAQRIKLAKELSRTDTGRTLYILDEPSTGLHFYDVKLLLKVLDKLVKKGNTLVVIEHNLDIISFADWIIDLGPEGGDEGGKLVFQGRFDDFLKFKDSYTSFYLRKNKEE
ncbi:MAG: UvrABC system protein A [candidate division TA06 bacterium 32_111]|uniref:UvrABC system protein A n=2 Tax=Bacteria candidate phyla TaxID=1783234 RepID=A0A124G0A8_UNCT6|nr:MAG: UvrABC system protein A [candidate division TA06 bacterium 32_111]KUK86772.1 MAG: UvrABC system protein A [candidate division TA06 bacterium 34_109]HAF08308.1 excinuclease ABC subunit UvrA [candidate division WOR-3 bacterium]HCP16562.1 excinuclease ABC subunit UvrA [candidate division WOR-3 bacterium]